MPSAVKLQVLDKIHEGHQGLVKCRERAKTSVWWPGLSREVQDMVENCKVCTKHRQCVGMSGSVSPSVEKKQARDKALTPLKQLPSPCLSSRPKRLIRPSLKLQESLGLC